MTDKVDELAEWILKYPSYTKHDMKEKIKTLITQQQYLLLDRVLEEVIGEDEDVLSQPTHNRQLVKSTRNLLKADLRQAIQSIKENL